MTSCRLLKSKNDAFCKICHLTTLTIKFLQGVLSTYYCTTLYDCHNSTDIFVNPYFFSIVYFEIWLLFMEFELFLGFS